MSEVRKQCDDAIEISTQVVLQLFEQQCEQVLDDTAYRCPISHEFFCDPVIADDGHTYERTSIEKYINSVPLYRLRSPMTNEAFASSYLKPNHFCRAATQAYKDSTTKIVGQLVPALIYLGEIDKAAKLVTAAEERSNDNTLQQLRVQVLGCQVASACTDNLDALCIQFQCLSGMDAVAASSAISRLGDDVLSRLSVAVPAGEFASVLVGHELLRRKTGKIMNLLCKLPAVTPSIYRQLGNVTMDLPEDVELFIEGSEETGDSIEKIGEGDPLDPHSLKCVSMMAH